MYGVIEAMYDVLVINGMTLYKHWADKQLTKQMMFLID